jgi:hypothetical protein
VFKTPTTTDEMLYRTMFFFEHTPSNWYNSNNSQELIVDDDIVVLLQQVNVFVKGVTMMDGYNNKIRSYIDFDSCTHVQMENSDVVVFAFDVFDVIDPKC